MSNLLFKAYAVTNEIDLNKIAIRCNIPKKFTWEEPLTLYGEILGSILETKPSSEQKVMVFSFGSVVFINIPSENISKFIEYIRTFKPDIDMKNWDSYSENYELRIKQDVDFELTDQYTAVPHAEAFYPDLVSTVIAKSVALEKTEEQLGKILDTLENMIDRLEKGRLSISNKELAKTTSRIVRHEYNTLAYIMILDKPDITWTNSDAARFYDRMTNFFELSDRYEIIKHKTDILNRILNGFSTISHSIRGLFIEWIIIILIVVEVILMTADLFR